MKPTQEQILNSLSKLIKENKTELQAEGKVKVELTTYADLLNHNKTFKKELPNKQSDVNETFSILKRQVQTGLSWAESAVSTLEDDLNKFAKSSKEIGFNPNDNDVYKDAGKTMAHAKKVVKYYKKALASVKKFG